LLREVIELVLAVNAGVDNVQGAFSYFTEKPLIAASAFAISFRGMEVAKLLTDNFIKNQETPPAKNVL
jgi:hypothetical protein